MRPHSRVPAIGRLYEVYRVSFGGISGSGGKLKRAKDEDMNLDNQNRAMTQTGSPSRPHLLTLVSPLVTLIAVAIALTSLRDSNRDFQIANRAYMSMIEMHSAREVQTNSLTISGTLVNAGNTPSLDTEIYAAPVVTGKVREFVLIRRYGMIEGKGQRMLTTKAAVLLGGHANEGTYFLLSFRDIFGHQQYLGRCMSEPPIDNECASTIDDSSVREFMGPKFSN